MFNNTLRNSLALAVSGVALMSAAGAWAADAAPDAEGTEGTSVAGIIVTAERSKAAETAPSKASLIETQPELIITRKFIEQATPETGGWETVLAIAPSISGVPANGGGVGETSKITLRGFQDGQFNITYDGIAFGDTNGPTHHAASYWPAPTIGSVVVDRGPGAAGDLGQANFGGALHFFSPQVTDEAGFDQKFTYGSFNTEQTNTAFNTGTLAALGGGKLLLSFEQRRSDGELSYSGGSAENLLAKYVLPVGDKATLTLFSSMNQTRFYQSDAGPGETWQQVTQLGKNFYQDNIPGDEHYYGYNYQYKQTDFEYADLKGEVFPSITMENQLYTYFYANKTLSTSSIVDMPGTGNASSRIATPVLAPGQKATDLEGYDKLNQYRVWGDIVRINKEWSFGTLKVGGQAEHATTDRHNLLLDFTDDFTPDLKFQGKKYPNILTPTNAKTAENSAYLTWQVFGDFDWRPTDKLTISPGFKYVQSKIDVDAANENVTGGVSKNEPLVGSNTYSSPLYFLTTNYKLRPDWSVYAQVATSFLLPGLPNLYYQGAQFQSLQPERTISYQAGTVYSRGNITADADLYRIDATDLQQQCNVIDGSLTPPAPVPALCNVGKARYSGVEGEAAYAFDFGVTLFANGALNSAKQLANAANIPAGIAANPAQTLTNAPKWTESFGAIYHHGPWDATLTYKQSGAYVAGYVPTGLANAGKALSLPGYDSIDASVAYDFGHFRVKLQGSNLADKRAITSFTPSATTNRIGSLFDATGKAIDTSLYEFQAGRQVSVTLEAKF